jgi:hypothetical protein
MIMTTIASFDRTLGLLAKARTNEIGATLLAAAKTVVGAISDGLSAAHDYRALTSRGMAPDEAAQRIFADHFQAR